MNLRNLLPKYFKEIKDFQWVMMTQTPDYEEIESNIDRVENNFFIETCDARTLAMHEQLLDITASSGESLDFRRERVISRYNRTVPYTIGAFRRQLDLLLGEGNYELDVFPNSYQISLYIPLESVQVHEEILNIVSYMIPAHIEFITAPTISSTISIGQLLDSTQVYYNYKLGLWKLGENPFATLISGGEVDDLANMTEYFLMQTAEFLATLPNKAIINETIEQPVIVSSVSYNNDTDAAEINLRYSIPDNIEQVTKIDIKHDDDTLITNDVNINVVANLNMLQTIIVKQEES